jgi:HEAT repeat protein
VAYHHAGKAVVANFSDNSHTMDLAGMKAAVAAGVDGINVDYPRLGADAVGRPVEQKIQILTAKASTGESAARSSAILELSRYRGFPLEDRFTRWLLDPDPRVSRAAAVALATARPRTQERAFAAALLSSNADARANAAWALGVLEAPATTLLLLLRDPDPQVLQATLLSLSRMPGDVPAGELLTLLSNPTAGVRGAAALALAKHQPDAALKAVPVQLRMEMKAALQLNDDYVRRGKPQLTPNEIEEITGHYRSQMKMVQAISMLRGSDAMLLLEEQAFSHGGDFVQMNGLVAGFQLWDRIGDDPLPAVQALASTDLLIANRAEWILVQGGPAVLPDVRKALSSSNAEIRSRAIRIVAWQGDAASLTTLQTMPATDSVLAEWAVEKIKSLHPEL